MERSECTRAFLLLVFISVVHLSPDPVLTFTTEGGRVELGGQDDYVLYRIHEDGDLLLVNCSQPDSPQPDGYHISCPSGYWGLMLNNLIMSHSGDYRVESRWPGQDGLVKSTTYRLVVCAEGEVDSTREVADVYVRDGSAVMCKFDSALGNGSTLKLYEYDIFKGHFTPVLDTSSSLEPLVPDLRDRLQVDTNTSVVTLTGTTLRDNSRRFLCTMWRGGRCQQARPHRLYSVRPVVVAHERENASLTCTFRGDVPEQVQWSTPIGDVRISSNQTQIQEVMYMLNGSQSGDYSLIIPYVYRQHAGGYNCKHSDFHLKYWLLVCVKFSPVNVMFSRGESVPMDLYVNDSETLLRAQWLRHKGIHPQMLITEYVTKEFARHYGVNDVRMPEDLVDRVTVFKDSTSLNISNLTAEDSGVYTWRVMKGPPGKVWNCICYEGSIRLVYRDPFGVNTPFYRAYGPLLGCVLLGLVAALIWLKLRSRGGALTSSGQEMEMQDIGDEDVEEAEDSV